MTTFSELTKQEYRVLELVAKGWRNSKIASELCISIRTVETHLYHIFDKLSVSSRTEAALYMVQASSLFNSEVRRIPDDSLVYSRIP
ncbi:MAG: response regulator transcription factor [Anaerolineae bacterium]|nr:response regulator transcription factor [Anaerolineae bacterium]